MKATEIKDLLNKYFEGATSLEEEETLKSFFNSDQVPLEFQSYIPHFQFFRELKNRKTENIIDDEQLFDGIKDNDKDIIKLSTSSHLPANSKQPWLRYAAVVALLILSFTVGLFVGSSNEPSSQVTVDEVYDGHKNEALLTGLRNESSASDRIMAINESRNIEKVDKEIAQALIKAMNYDENINVRLAAIEALSHFTDHRDVRSAIINSLELQDNPMIQIALIDLLVKLGEKKAINEMQRIIIDEKTQDVVKQRAQIGVALLM